MGKQSEVAAHIERLNFALKASKAKFDQAMDQGQEFHELKKILMEIKGLENEMQDYQRREDGSGLNNNSV